MPRMSAKVAAKIDRLSRHAHAFHRFAHHPLCERYRGELVQVGRTRLCRGCLLAGVGAAAGIPLGFALPSLGLFALGAWLVTLAVGLSRPARRGKLWTRLLPALGLATAVGAGLRGPSAFGLALAAVASAGAALFLWSYRRRGPNREPCRTCPEWNLAVPCSGFRPIVRREAAFRRLSSRWLDAPTPRAAASTPASP